MLQISHGQDGGSAVMPIGASSGQSSPAYPGLFGPTLGDRFHVGASPFVTMKSRRQGDIAATRLACAKETRPATLPVMPERAFSVLVHGRAVRRHELRLLGSPVFSAAVASGGVSVVDLEEEPIEQIEGPFEAVQFYIPRVRLDAFAQERAGCRIERLDWTRGTPDPVLLSLSTMLAAALEEAHEVGSLFAEQLLLAALAHIAQAYGGLQPNRFQTGGLAPWQERRAKEILRARHGMPITIADVARECRLTPSHFSRAFRRTTGTAPHDYLTQIRLEEARTLMRTTELPLADIALACGFGDQSYFTRVFKRAATTSPGRWRRQFAVDGSSTSARCPSS